MRANLLCDRLPETIVLDGQKLPLETDFRRWILLLELLCDCTDGLAVTKGASLLVCPTALSYLEDGRLAEDFFAAILSFAEGGGQRVSSAGKAGNTGPVFDFALDAERIYASFQAVYGMDLTRVRLHWWKFLALLRCLPQDSAFGELVHLRGLDLATVMDDGLRRTLRRARAAVRIRKGEGETWQTDR